MQVRTILSTKGADVFSISPDQTVQDVLALFGDRKIGFAVVRDDKEALLGTISERDVCQALRSQKADGLAAKAGDVMTRNIVSCGPEDTLPKIMALMTGRRTRHVLVMEGGELHGLVSIGDVVKYRLDEVLKDEAALREYIDGTGYSYMSSS